MKKSLSKEVKVKEINVLSPIQLHKNISNLNALMKGKTPEGHALNDYELIRLGSILLRHEYVWHLQNPPQSKKQAGRRGGLSKQAKKKPALKKGYREKIRKAFTGKTWHDIEEFIEKQAKEGIPPKLEAMFSKVFGGKGNQRWRTPPDIAKSAREIMGGIDLDPASEPEADKTIQAKKFFTEKEDGLKQVWKGNIFLNPPFAEMEKWTDKLLKEIDSGHTQKAILIAPSSTGSWFNKVLRDKNFISICSTKGKVKFLNPNGGPSKGSPAQIFILAFGNIGYLAFEIEFETFGHCVSSSEKNFELGRLYGERYATKSIIKDLNKVLSKPFF